MRIGDAAVIGSAVFLFGAPFLIILHECGHFVCFKAHGCDAVVRTAFTTWNGSFESSEALHRAVMQSTVAGPAVNFFLAILGVIAMMRFDRRKFETDRVTIQYWLASLCCASGFRWFKTVLQGRETDEAFISENLGFASYVIPVTMLPFSVFILVFLIVVHFRMKTLVPLFAAVSAGIAGAGLWLRIVGPAILGV